MRGNIENEVKIVTVWTGCCITILIIRYELSDNYELPDIVVIYISQWPNESNEIIEEKTQRKTTQIEDELSGFYITSFTRKITRLWTKT